MRAFLRSAQQIVFRCARYLRTANPKIAKELVFQAKQRKLGFLLRRNLMFLLGKKTVSFYLHSPSHKNYFLKTYEKFQEDPRVQVIVLTRYASNEKNALQIRHTPKIVMSHLHLCTITESKYILKPLFTKTASFPHSLLSIFCEGFVSFRGFDYVLCPSRPLFHELHIHLKSEPTQILPSCYERLAYAGSLTSAPRKLKGLIALTRTDLLDVSEKLENFITRALQKYEIVFRPHPLDFEKNPQLIEMIQRQFGNHHGFSIDRTPDIKSEMESSGFFVSDWSGSAIHFALCYDRPVLSLDTPYPYDAKETLDPALEPLFEKRLEKIFREELSVVVQPGQDIEESLHLAVDKLRKKDEFIRDNFFSVDPASNYRQILELLNLPTS